MSLFLGNESPYLIQFNAGKCVLENTTVSPDVRKGVIYMDQSDDQLMHLYWRERKATQPEEDMILFPDEAELFKVEACTTGRVYVLKFKSSRQRLFFWMQDKDEAEDEARVQRVLQLMNHPQSALQSPSMSFDGSTSELIQMFNDGQDIDITQENLLQFLQSAGGLGSNALLDTSSKGELSLQQLTELRHKMEQAREQEETEGETPSPAPNHSEVRSEPLFSLLRNKPMRMALFSFVQQSPPTLVSVYEIQQSPEFSRALSTLSILLANGALDRLTRALKIENKDIGSFLHALEEQARRQEEEEKEEEAMEEDQ